MNIVDSAHDKTEASTAWLDDGVSCMHSLIALIAARPGAQNPVSFSILPACPRILALLRPFVVSPSRSSSTAIMQRSVRRERKAIARRVHPLSWMITSTIACPLQVPLCLGSLACSTSSLRALLHSKTIDQR